MGRIDTAYPSPGVTIKVISGESHGVTVCLSYLKSECITQIRADFKGFVRPVGGCWYLDFRLSEADATVFQPIPKGWTAFVYGLPIPLLCK
jgi:hypothetical protein